MPRTVLTFGTFDLFHVGHVRILQRAAKLGDRLVVGVSSDAFNMRKKGRVPTFNESQRMEIVAALRCVDKVFLEESMEEKAEYLRREGADVFTMGDDWKGRFDAEAAELGIEVVYFPRTENVSTTEFMEHIVRSASATPAATPATLPKASLRAMSPVASSP